MFHNFGFPFPGHNTWGNNVHIHVFNGNQNDHDIDMHQRGNFSARSSTLKNITAFHNIDLFDTTAKNVKSVWGDITANQSYLGRVTAHNHVGLIDSSATDVRSKYGAVSVKGTGQALSKVTSISAHNDVYIDRASVESRTKSAWGQVSAHRSNLGKVTAHNSIDLIDTSAADVRSEYGAVTVKGTGEVQSKVSNISAHNDVYIDRASVESRTKSAWGHVSAHRSSLGSVAAHKSIDLVDSSATDVHSEWGSVTVRQTDGSQRRVSHISAQNEVVAENCLIDHLTLRVNQDREAFLDLTNSIVTDKIVIKVDQSVSKTIRIFSIALSWSFWKVEREGSVAKSKEFSLLIKGAALPENISFEGYEADEITTETTINGILVKGKKK